MREYVINITNDGVIKKNHIVLCLLTFFHTVCFILYTFVSCYGIYIYRSITDDMMKNINIDNIVKYIAFYVTFWNFFFQTVFLTLSVIYNIMQWLNINEKRLGKWLKYCCDVLFSGAVVPITLFVSSMFWIIFWIDRELVFPKVYDEAVPWWFNHCVHTNIIIFVLIETILQERRHPRNFKLEFILTVFIGVLYAIVYYTIYFTANRWLYGVFGVMTWWQVCLFQLLIWASTYFFYFIQFPINRIFHRKPAVDAINDSIDVKDVRIKGTKDRIIDENMSKFDENCS